MAALVSVFFLAVFLAFQLLEINMDFSLANVFGEFGLVFSSVVTVHINLLPDLAWNSKEELLSFKGYYFEYIS